MNENIKAAILQCRAATALIRAMGMQEENERRKAVGLFGYTEQDFLNVISEEGICWNSVCAFIYPEEAK